MKANTLLMFAFAFFTVTLNTACPRDIADKLAENDKLVKEYNDKAKEANKIAWDLEFTYNLPLGSNPIFGVIVSDSTWSGKQKEHLPIIQQKLTRYMELAHRLKELSEHENVKSSVKDGEQETIRKNMYSVGKHLESLNAYLAKNKP